MTTASYSSDIVQDTVRFAELYTRMARQLCESLMTAKHIGIADTREDLNNFEIIMKKLYELETIEPFWYKGQYWNTDRYGERCLFTSDSGLQVEVNMHDSNEIDAAFFRLFLMRLPAAQMFIRMITPADFTKMLDLMEYVAGKNLLIQCDETNFKIQSSK